MIWDRAPHNAFTDLTRYHGRWYCTFREAGDHAPSVGKVRLLSSEDGTAWQSAALFSLRGVDLRDPKFSRAPGGLLELVMGASPVRNGRYVGRGSLACRTADGAQWTPPRAIAGPGDWLWRVERAGGRSYGISYRLPSRRLWTVHLLESVDGLLYNEITRLPVTGLPNEATVRFQGQTAVALVRREAGRGLAWIGTSAPPYRSWKWNQARERVGGPNFIVLPHGGLIAAARLWKGGRPCVAICAMTRRALTPVLELPSGGDCGYPGLVCHRGLLWVSYYSSHEGKSRIYLAKVRPKGLQPGLSMRGAPYFDRRGSTSFS